MTTPKNPAAVALGRKGGAAKVRKGLAALSPERRAEIAAKGVAGRRRKKANIAVLRQILEDTIADHSPAIAKTSKH